MRLLNVHTLEIESGFVAEGLTGPERQLWHDSTTTDHTAAASPPYAILSHTWLGDETTLQTFNAGPRHQLRDPPPPYAAAANEQGPSSTSAGTGDPPLRKIAGACAQVRRDAASSTGGDDQKTGCGGGGSRADRIRHVWIDTVCIDRTDAHELGAAINSMFQWYRDAEVCYAHLADVSWDVADSSRERQFLRSRWFRRGWTLQELLAPRSLVFFDRDWRRIGSRTELAPLVSRASGIAEEHLRPGGFRAASLAQRMSWLARRETALIEDRAYCMLGILETRLDVRYGAGPAEFMRLQHEIVRSWDEDLRGPLDETLFAWRDARLASCGLFAPAPSCFRDSGAVVFDRARAKKRSPFRRREEAFPDHRHDHHAVAEDGPGFRVDRDNGTLILSGNLHARIYPLITVPLTAGFIVGAVLPIALAKAVSKSERRLRLNAWTRDAATGELRCLKVSMTRVGPVRENSWRRVDCGVLHEVPDLYLSASDVLKKGYGTMQIVWKIPQDLKFVETASTGQARDQGTTPKANTEEAGPMKEFERSSATAR